jgi:hypothetical protein
VLSFNNSLSAGFRWYVWRHREMEGSQQKESQRYLWVHRMPELLWYALFCANDVLLDFISIKTSFFHFTGLFVNHTLLWLLSFRAGEAGLPNLSWNRRPKQQGASPTTRRKEVAWKDVQRQAVAQLLGSARKMITRSVWSDYVFQFFCWDFGFD